MSILEQLQFGALVWLPTIAVTAAIYVLWNWRE